MQPEWPQISADSKESLKGFDHFNQAIQRTYLDSLEIRATPNANFGSCKLHDRDRQVTSSQTIHLLDKAVESNSQKQPLRISSNRHESKLQSRFTSQLYKLTL